MFLAYRIKYRISRSDFDLIFVFFFCPASQSIILYLSIQTKHALKDLSAFSLKWSSVHLNNIKYSFCFYTE